MNSRVVIGPAASCGNCEKLNTHDAVFFIYLRSLDGVKQKQFLKIVVH